MSEVQTLPEWADPGDKVVTGELVGPIEARKWTKFITLVADGVVVPKALDTAGITRWALDGAIRTNSMAREQYEGAKLAAVQRTWDMDIVEEVLTKLMLCEQGGYLKRILEDMGLDPSGFYLLMQRDPLVREMYDEARQIQAEVMSDELQGIADDGSNDTYTDGKGNVRVDQDVVQRSRLRVDTLKWRLAKLHHKRFGDKIQTEQEVNLKVDHAEKLTAGQKRLEKLAADRAKGGR